MTAPTRSACPSRRGLRPPPTQWSASSGPRSRKHYPGARVDAGESVSGKVSEELAQNSALGDRLAMIGIAVYIWFRFEWQFGVGALLTLAHDVSMTFGFFAFTRLAGRSQRGRGLPHDPWLFAQ